MEGVAYEELLKKDGRVITHVVGGSMLPLLHERESIVIVEDVGRVPPRRGDVVLYKMGGRYILHRVLRIEGEAYVIRGDNTWTLEHVPKTALLATMTGFFRRPKSRLTGRKNVVYRLYCLALPGIRWARRVSSLAKRAIRKLCRFASFHHPQDENREN